MAARAECWRKLLLRATRFHVSASAAAALLLLLLLLLLLPTCCCIQLLLQPSHPTLPPHATPAAIGTWKEQWDLVVLVLILYSAAVVPVRVCFDADAKGALWFIEVTGRPLCRLASLASLSL